MNLLCIESYRTDQTKIDKPENFGAYLLPERKMPFAI